MLNLKSQNNLLKAMQIVTYTPRLQLPFAPIEEIKPIVLANHKNKIPHKQKISNNAKDILNTAKSKITTDLEADTPIFPKPILEPKFNETPYFNLQLVRSKNCLILLDLPDKRPLLTHTRQHNLLQAILRAAQLESNYQPIGEPLFWPLFKSKIIMQDAKAANEYICSVITHQTKSNPYACLWLMGINAQKFGATLDKTWLLPSLQELTNNPQAKREVWEQMKQKLSCG